jgi:hypothetical protein
MKLQNEPELKIESALTTINTILVEALALEFKKSYEDLKDLFKCSRDLEKDNSCQLRVIFTETLNNSGPVIRKLFESFQRINEPDYQACIEYPSFGYDVEFNEYIITLIDKNRNKTVHKFNVHDNESLYYSLDYRVSNFNKVKKLNINDIYKKVSQYALEYCVANLCRKTPITKDKANEILSYKYLNHDIIDTYDGSIIKITLKV